LWALRTDINYQIGSRVNQSLNRVKVVLDEGRISAKAHAAMALAPFGASC